MTTDGHEMACPSYRSGRYRGDDDAVNALLMFATSAGSTMIGEMAVQMLFQVFAQIIIPVAEMCGWR